RGQRGGIPRRDHRGDRRRRSVAGRAAADRHLHHRRPGLRDGRPEGRARARERPAAIMNAIIDFALGHSRTVLSALVLLIVAGIAAYIDLPKESDPNINIPVIYVLNSLEGISPEDPERLLLRPMEQQLRTIEGVKEMKSIGYQGGGSVVLTFDAGFDAKKALDDVRNKVDIAKAKIPTDAEEPTVHEVNTSLFPVLVVSLSGDLPQRTLQRLAIDLRDKIEGIDSVLEATISGNREELLERMIDP